MSDTVRPSLLLETFPILKGSSCVIKSQSLGCVGITEAGAMLVVNNLKGLNYLDISNCLQDAGYNNLSSTIEKQLRDALPRATIRSFSYRSD